MKQLTWGKLLHYEKIKMKYTSIIKMLYCINSDNQNKHPHTHNIQLGYKSIFKDSVSIATSYSLSQNISQYKAKHGYNCSDKINSHSTEYEKTHFH